MAQSCSPCPERLEEAHWSPPASLPGPGPCGRGARGVCSQLGTWVTGQLCLLRLLIPFAPTRQMGLKYKPKSPKTTQSPGEAGEEGGEMSPPPAVGMLLQGGTGSPPPSAGELGEARQAHLGWAPRAEQGGQQGHAGPSPPEEAWPRPPLPPAAVTPSVPPPWHSPFPHAQLAWLPVLHSVSPAGAGLGGRGAAGVGSQDGEGDARPQPPRWDRRVPPWSRGGEGSRAQSCAAALGRAGGGAGAGGLSWGCGSGWLPCCRSPGTRWT